MCPCDSRREKAQHSRAQYLSLSFMIASFDGTLMVVPGELVRRACD
jgi:hypothetical protein